MVASPHQNTYLQQFIITIIPHFFDSLSAMRSYAVHIITISCCVAGKVAVGWWWMVVVGGGWWWWGGGGS